VKQLIAFLFCALLAGAPALAAASIQDGAGMLSAATVSQLDGELADFTAQTGKQVVVVTVPSLNGKSLQDAAQAVFQQQDVNGVLVFIAKDDRADIIVPGPATAQFFPGSTLRTIRQSMEALFKAEDYDGGVTSAVNGILNVFRAHLSSLNNAPAARADYPAAVPAQTTYVATRHQGVHFGMFTILLLVIGFLIVRSIFRSMGPRYYGPGPGYPPGGPAGGYPPPGPGYGGYGYGPGYYGGGGGFWSGLLGGLGGAWLGNEMFGNHGNTTIIDQQPGAMMPTDQGGSWGGGDSGGWANDGGVADMGGSSGGDWSGGGFGGGGDFGGGGFGGGDSGGGW
jgi:uncharacterized membrane protein YgcG